MCIRDSGESVDTRLVTVWASMVSMWTLVTVGLDGEQVDTCDCGLGEHVDTFLVTVWAWTVSMWTFVTVGLDGEQVDTCDCGLER